MEVFWKTNSLHFLNNIEVQDTTHLPSLFAEYYYLKVSKQTGNKFTMVLVTPGIHVTTVFFMLLLIYLLTS